MSKERNDQNKQGGQGGQQQGGGSQKGEELKPKPGRGREHCRGRDAPPVRAVRRERGDAALRRHCDRT